MTFYEIDSFPSQNLAAIDENDARLSYGDLQKYSLAFGQQMAPRHLAFVMTRNSLGCIAAFVTLINRTVVPLLLDAELDDNSLLKLLSVYKPEYILDQTMRPVIENDYYLVAGLLDYKLFRRTSANTHALHPDLALLMSTSGSTGSPKLVRQSYSNLKSNGDAIAKFLGLTQFERPVTSLPLHYSYGLSVVNSHIATGATLLVTDKSLLAKEFWEFVSRFGATSLSGVPYSYSILNRLGFEKMQLPSLRTLTQAGGRMSHELTVKFAQITEMKHMNFYVMYGQTEATARMSFVPPNELLKKIGSVGIPIPGGQFFITDSQGNIENRNDVEGELHYRGENVAMGYAESTTDLAKGDQWNGQLKTGDRAKRDVDGYYFVTGRSNRYVKIFGSRLSLDDIEGFVNAMGTDCACVGSENLVTVYVSSAELKSSIKRSLSEWTGVNPIAFHVEFIESIPRNSAGKVQYQQLVNAVRF